MIIKYSKEFLKDLEKLSEDAKELFESQRIIFDESWLDSRLHIKKMKGINGCFSFRVTRRYRVLFYFKNKKEVVFFKIGHRKDIYNKM